MSEATDVQSLTEAFFSVAQVPHDQTTKAFLNRCQSHTLRVAGRFYKYYRRGSGPTVLHVHGIHSNLGSMTAIAEQLLEHGHQVVLFDAPAHGEALGTSTDPFEVREVIRGLYERLGEELHAVVSHSLGGLWALAAWDRAVRAKAMVSISSPADQEFVLAKFRELHGMDDEAFQTLVAELERRFGKELWTEFSPATIAPTMDVPGLVMHGAQDDYVPLEHARELHSKWQGSAMELVEGAGHFDIVRLPAVGRAISAYLQELK